MEAYLLQGNVLQAMHMNSPPPQIKYLKKYNLTHNEKHFKNEKIAIGFQQENGFFEKMINLACKSMNSYGNRRILHKGNLIQYLEGVPKTDLNRKKKSVKYHHFQHINQHKRSKSAKMPLDSQKCSLQIKFQKYCNANFSKTLQKEHNVLNQDKARGHLGVTHNNSFGNSPRTEFYDFDIGVIKQRGKICLISQDRKKMRILSSQKDQIEQIHVNQKSQQDNKIINTKENLFQQKGKQRVESKAYCHLKCKQQEKQKQNKKLSQIIAAKRTKHLTADDIIGQFRQNYKKQNAVLNMKSSLNVQQHKPMSNKQLKERSLQIMKKNNFTQSRTSQFFNFLENWNTG